MTVWGDIDWSLPADRKHVIYRFLVALAVSSFPLFHTTLLHLCRACSTAPVRLPYFFAPLTTVFPWHFRIRQQRRHGKVPVDVIPR